MNECNYCAYRIKEDDQNAQSCSKWVNRENYNEPCNPSNGAMGDEPSNDSDNCVKIECPSHCYFPYTKDVYNLPASDDEYYDSLGIFPDYNHLNENPNLLSEYVRHASNPELLNGEYREYNNNNVPEGLNLKCGVLISPDDGNIMNFPELPTEEALREIIEHNVDNVQNRGINWGTIKYTDKLVELLGDRINDAQTEVQINSYTIPITHNGIELEWWESQQLSVEQLRRPIPDDISEYTTLDQIHSMTGNLLEHIFPGHDVDGMVIEQVYDWLLKNDIETNLEGMGMPTEGFKMANFFGITTDDVTNRQFEICMNELLITEHDDNEHIRRINTYNNLTDIGKPNNRKDLLYIEAKIIKFLTLQPSQISKCFDIVYITDEICQIGLTKNPMKMIGSLLKLNTDNIDDENYDENMRIVSGRLLNYLPEMIKKIIEISEYYENKKCNEEIHKNTILLKEIYKNLFEENLMDDFNFPSLGITEFFKDFQKNIITKIILLFFISYIIAQFIQLFKFNINVK